MDTNYWVIVPAAGSARRMGAAVPKQYLPLAGRTVIAWSLAPFLERERISGVVVVLAEGDPRWSLTQLGAHAKIITTTGGAERMDSVLAGLQALETRASARDWVLVHDAARPCLSSTDLDRLVNELSNDEVGGLLAAPVVDTLKRADARGAIERSEPRERLWRALTPQLFRRGELERALESAFAAGVTITDEAMAFERLGRSPLLVEGADDNLKLTTPADLAIAESLLSRIDA